VIQQLRPYQAYKDSGVRWIGNVPEHWAMRRLRTVVDMRVSGIDKISNDHEIPVRLCNYIDVYKNSRITDALAFMRATASQQEIRRFRLKTDDVIITKDSEAWDDIGVPALVEYAAPDLVCGYHLALLRTRDESTITGQYLYRAIQSEGVATQLHVAANGVTRFGLSHGDIKSLMLPIPHVDEQMAIVRFLNYADRRIRRGIRAKQKLIRLLEEQKQAVIDRTVTRGLSLGVPLKHSGAPWLGDVPGHWNVIALRRRWTVTDCKHVTVPFTDEGIPLASVREAQSFELNFETANRTTPEWYENLIEGGRRPRSGDLIYCRNVSVGAAALVLTEDRFAMGQDVCLIRSNSENQRWLNYFLHSKAMSDQLASILIGSTFYRINVADIKALLIAVPPRQEQDRIAAFLDDKLMGIDAGIQTCRKEQAALREFLAGLITNVVTGKLDVREAAAILPDETGEVEIPLEWESLYSDENEEALAAAELDDEEVVA
jgi:type I restriction enzyme, S subunit